MSDCQIEEKRQFLQPFLAALAYRTQKALRDAPESFFSFCAAPRVRTPLELIRHMESVMGYARTFFVGGIYDQEPLDGSEHEILRFHATLEDLTLLLRSDKPLIGITAEQLLQGPFCDAMTHAGQLAILRRIAGSPVPPENFIYAEIRSENVTANHPNPVQPGNRRGECNNLQDDYDL